MEYGQRQRPGEIDTADTAIIAQPDRWFVFEGLAHLLQPGIGPGIDDHAFLEDAIGQAKQEDCGPTQMTPAYDLANQERATAIEQRVGNEREGTGEVLEHRSRAG